VTGEIHHVDSGYNTVAMPRPETIKETGEGTAAVNGNNDAPGGGERIKAQAAE
jgi:hypothetical protein